MVGSGNGWGRGIKAQATSATSACAVRTPPRPRPVFGRLRTGPSWSPTHARLLPNNVHENKELGKDHSTNSMPSLE